MKFCRYGRIRGRQRERERWREGRERNKKQKSIKTMKKQMELTENSIKLKLNCRNPFLCSRIFCWVLLQFANYEWMLLIHTLIQTQSTALATFISPLSLLFCMSFCVFFTQCESSYICFHSIQTIWFSFSIYLRHSNFLVIIRRARDPLISTPSQQPQQQPLPPSTRLLAIRIGLV